MLNNENNSFIRDRDFMEKLVKYRILNYKARATLLDFQTEKEIKGIEGQLISYSPSFASSSVRRTAQLTLATTKDLVFPFQSSMESAKTKVKIAIGMKNPFYNTFEYSKYGEVLWFPQGIFFITSLSSSISGEGLKLSMQLIDKMGGLNGTVGGVLPATTSFHDRVIIDEEENVTVSYPIISQIIKELVHHFGGEKYSNIIVEDIPDYGRTIVKYIGNTPINFSIVPTTPYATKGISFIIGDPPITNYNTTYYKGDVVGYKEVPLTYPGELIFKAGTTVEQVLNQIAQTLGNFEFFYDVEGRLIFRRIQDFDRTGQVTLNIGAENDSLFQGLYFPKVGTLSHSGISITPDMIKSLSITPNLNEIKNDFICWGSGKRGETNALVRYHLAIDKRPTPIWPLGEGPPGAKEALPELRNDYSLCFKNIYEIRETSLQEDKPGAIIRYQIGQEINPGESVGKCVAPDLREVISGRRSEHYFNWREELYRRALLSYGSSTRGSYYDEELMAEWRNLFDPTSQRQFLNKDGFREKWESYFGSREDEVPWTGYSLDVLIAPEQISYWLDILEPMGSLADFSVEKIGRRTIVQENSKISEVFGVEINDILFIDNEMDEEEKQKKIEYYLSIGQGYCLISKDVSTYFQEKSSFGTCFEDVRLMLWEHCILKNTISLETIPIFQIEVNEAVRINYPEIKMNKDFLVKNLSWNVNEGVMSLQLSEIVNII